VSGKYYTYELAYPESMGGAVFYVGKGKTEEKPWQDRINAHEREAMRGHDCQRHQIIRRIWENGEEVIKRKVFETDVEQDALIYEWVLVNLIYGRENLANMTAAGGIKDKQLLSTSSKQYQKWYHLLWYHSQRIQKQSLKNP
jgi:hypothetical protein